MPNPMKNTAADVRTLMWPGITRGFDARCSCTWAPKGGVYQVKLRDPSCANHGGSLQACLSRMGRWRARGHD